MTPQQFARISELTRLSRARPLTEAEQAERAALREAYRASIRSNLEGNLQRIHIQEADGTVKPVVKKSE